MKQLLLQILGFYQRWLSPALHAVSPLGCRYHPTCSQYAAEAISLHGASRGSRLAFKRLLRCHPFARSGFDPVPLPTEPPVRPTSTIPSAILPDPLP